MRAYIVRHGQTLFNVKKIIQGWCDSPLTKTGIQQAIEAGKKLENVDFEWAYSSTSERAVDTMNLILKNRNVNTSHRKGLKEINFGMIDGESERVIFQTLKIDRNNVPDYGGESPAMALARFQKELLKISEKHSGNVLIVCHGGIMANLMRKYAPDVMEKVGHPIRNGSIFVFDIDTDFQYIDKM